MADSRQHTRGRADAHIRRGTWKHEPPPGINRGRVLLGMLAAAGVAAAVVLGDGEWAWRDSIRRMAQGEEIPAFRANAWEDARAVRESLAEDLLTAELSPSVEDKDTRRSLALHALIVAAGEEQISRGGREMGVLLEELCLDVDWLEEIVYFCPMVHAETALPVLAHIYSSEKKKMVGMPANRRLAAAIAFEFARAGLDKQKAHEAYLFYAASGQKHWLNNRFSELALWEMRVIATRCADASWSHEETLNWFQRNCRLPARAYVTLGNTLGRHERSLFGEPVGTSSFFALYRDAAEGGLASMYEASDCSTPRARAEYAATAACANGVPALVLSGAENAACLVDVNGKWMPSAPVAEGMSSTWSFCGQVHPSFVELVSLLGGDMEKTLSSSRLAAMAQFHYDSGNQPRAHSFFREAVKTQPLNYAAWAAFHASGAPKAEMAEAVKHFEQLPGVAAVLGSLKSE